MSDMNIVKRQLSELKHPPLNVRMHPDKQIAELKRSLRKNGQTRLIVIDEAGTIWIGNGLYQAMSELGYTEAYCLLKEGMTERDKKKMMASDNRIFDLGVDDMSAFDQLLRDLDGDLDVPGYDEDLLRTLTADLGGVDDIMSSYGLVDDEKKEEITAAKETYSKRDEAFAADAEEYVPQPSPAPAVTRAPDREEPPAAISQQNQPEHPEIAAPAARKYILCPKCGERIWL